MLAMDAPLCFICDKKLEEREHKLHKPVRMKAMVKKVLYFS